MQPTDTNDSFCDARITVSEQCDPAVVTGRATMPGQIIMTAHGPSRQVGSQDRWVFEGG
jgi:hypothetical protein